MKRGIVMCNKFMATGCKFASKVEGWFTSTDFISLDTRDGDVEQNVDSGLNEYVMYAASVRLMEDDHKHGPDVPRLRRVVTTELLTEASDLYDAIVHSFVVVVRYMEMKYHLRINIRSFAGVFRCRRRSYIRGQRRQHGLYKVCQ